jgi:aspartate racemase
MEGSTMRTIGILGGAGPQATMAFEAQIHAESRHVIPQHVNEGYPPMVSVYIRHAPVVVDAEGKPVYPLTLDPRVVDAVKRLGEWADLLAIPSNTPHFFVDEIAAASGCEVVSIVDVTVEELHRRQSTPIGLLGLGVPQVYVERFEQEQFEIVTAPPEIRAALDTAILRLMEGAETDTHRAAARAAVNALRAAGAATTVLGCTEIPLLLGAEATSADLVDPSRLLARAVVRRAVE